MATIIRVKRHRQDDPVEAVVLACKRRKIVGETQDLDSFKTILNFTGTVEKKDDKAAALLLLQNKDGVKTHKLDIKNKKRDENKKRTEENRFKVISCLRSLKVNELLELEEANKKNVTIVDVNAEKKDESEEGASSSENAYVYDVYSTYFESEDDYNDLYIENLLSVHPLGYELQFQETEESCNEEYDDVDEDSNDENNCRNDYPDTDNSVDEDDMRLANKLKGFGIDDGNDLSSDDQDEKYPNYDDDGGDDYLHYKKAEDLAGSKYAKFKRTVMKDLELSEDEDSY